MEKKTRNVKNTFQKRKPRTQNLKIHFRKKKIQKCVFCKNNLEFKNVFQKYKARIFHKKVPKVFFFIHHPLFKVIFIILQGHFYHFHWVHVGMGENLP